MKKSLGSIKIHEEKIIVEYDYGLKQVFEKDKPNYSVGSEWITWEGERYFLKKD